MEREGLGHNGRFTIDGELVNYLAAVGLDLNTVGARQCSTVAQADDAGPRRENARLVIIINIVIGWGLTLR